MNEEKKDSKTEKTEKPKSTPATTLGDAAQLVPVRQLEFEKECHQSTRALLSKAEAELVAEKAIVAARDLVLKEKERLLVEAGDTRNLAVKETCEAKSKLVVANKLIESLKADIENLKLDVERKRGKVKLAMALASDYRKESAKLHARLSAEGISLEPLSEEPVLDEEDAVEEGATP
jgi:hypothetical protein